MKLNETEATRMKALCLIMSIVMVASLTVGAFDFGAVRTFAKAENDGETGEKIKDSFPALSMDETGSDDDELTKNETVYVIMDADGKTEKKVVSEWLKNPEGKKTIEDSSDLENIENTSGDEEFEKDGEDLVWNAEGRDIKYQGETSKELPVDVKISYYLNGDKVSAEEIAGKSGDVEIHFDYEINKKVTFPGAAGAYDMAKPYVMASGLVLDNSKFSDIEVSGGKAVSEGDMTVCLGIAMPGLGEDLGIEKGIMNIPEEVVVSARAEDFEIDGTYTAALSGGLSELDLDGIDASGKVDTLEQSFDQLLSASTALVKGSDELADGAFKLDDGAGALETGTTALDDGAEDLSGGAAKLYKGVKKLDKGAGALANGTSQLKKKSGALSDGVSKLYDGSKALTEGTGELKKGSEEAVEGSKELAEGLGQLSASSESIVQASEAVVDRTFDSFSKQLSDATGQAISLTRENYDAVLDNLSSVLPQETVATIRGTLKSMVDYETGIKEYTAGVDNAAKGSSGLSDGIKKLDNGIGKVDSGASDIYGGLGELSNGIPELKKGIKALNKGASQAKKGTGKLKKGMKSLKNGTGKLYDGTGKLKSGVSELKGGTSKLAAGADTLADGMFRFDRDGIRKLVGAFDTAKIKEVLGRFEVIKKESETPVYVGGAAPGISGDNKIVFKTGEVKA